MIRAAAAGALLLISLCAAGQEACFSACHGAGGASATPLTPSLGGQPSFFVLAQLFLFREGTGARLFTCTHFRWRTRERGAQR